MFHKLLQLQMYKSNSPYPDPIPVPKSLPLTVFLSSVNETNVHPLPKTSALMTSLLLPEFYRFLCSINSTFVIHLESIPSSPFPLELPLCLSSALIILYLD